MFAGDGVRGHRGVQACLGGLVSREGLTTIFSFKKNKNHCPLIKELIILVETCHASYNWPNFEEILNNKYFDTPENNFGKKWKIQKLFQVD